MLDAEKENVLQALSPTDEDKFYVEWGREVLKSNLAFANDVLRQLVTLNATLLGGSIAFLDDQVINEDIKTVVVCIFLLSLIISFIGIMPHEGLVDLRIPSEIRRNRQLALKWKRRYLWTAGVFLALGFGVAIAGYILKLLKSS